MATRLVLDAMIRRADFWQKGATNLTDNIASAKPASSITFENLRTDSNFVLSLRKPDFQRETNQWSVNQALIFLQSFLDGDLVPSVILWQSDDGFIFAIDGAHRLSTLRAWIEDDYGDGLISIAFYGGEIPEAQKRAGKAMRLAVERQLGSYRSLKDKLSARAVNPEVEYESKTNKRLKHLGSRQLELQWVSGDADVAEASFFKINTQGTPLDKTEEALLRNRSRAPAIAARSMVRAATGHKYWSKFDDTVRRQIEKLAFDVNVLLFHPEISTPIKTLQLPLGGSASTLDALALLLRLLSITDGTQTNRKQKLEDAEHDSDGSLTVATLKNALGTLERMSGNGHSSLGLHPVVYFYSDRGKYMPDLFLGMAYLLKGKLLNNDSGFFKKFTTNRAKIEAFLNTNKALISQILQQVTSRARVERVADMFDYLVLHAGDGLSIEGIANAARLKGSIVDLREKVEGKSFSDAGKSAIMIRQALKSALQCPICDGLLEPSISVSYDHITRKGDGGGGDAENGQLCHPYCNTGFKN
ncbi:GmrSD restriction endonuclease domain-containing protein [Roseovarius sp. D0-M9]|uniref:GmrSD restriction endonuclease domain-containing protein n=1 Tax=Roseovarius sp. D0-M9 TaxID=3127117 RepID=UPI0030102F3F